MTQEADPSRRRLENLGIPENTADMRRLAQGGLALGASTAVATLLSLPAVAVIVRSLGVKSYGELAFTLGLVQIAATVADLGLGNGVTRMTALAGLNADGRWARSGFGIALISGSVAAVGCAAAAFTMSGSRQNVLLTASVLPFAVVLRAVVVAFLRVRRRIALAEGSYVFGQIFYYVGAMALAALGLATATHVALLRVVAMSSALLLVLPAWLRLTANLPPGPANWKPLLRFSFPLLLAGIGTFALQTSDVIMLGLIRGSHAVGLYSPVLQTADLISLIIYVLSTYFLPIATGIVAEGDMLRLRSLYATVTKWGLVLAGPLLSALIVAPGPLLEALFGSHYGGSETALIARILSIGYAATVITGLNGLSLTALGASKAIGVRSAIAFAVNIALNALLIYKFGAVGAAIGTSTVYVGLNLANSALIWKLGRQHPVRRDLVAVGGAVTSLTILSFVLVSLLDWHGSIRAPLVTALIVAAGSLATWAATSSLEERRSLLASLAR